MADPTETDPDKYVVVFENDRVPPTHAFFIELKGEAASQAAPPPGPS